MIMRHHHTATCKWRRTVVGSLLDKGIVDTEFRNAQIDCTRIPELELVHLGWLSILVNGRHLDGISHFLHFLRTYQVGTDGIVLVYQMAIYFLAVMIASYMQELQCMQVQHRSRGFYHESDALRLSSLDGFRL